MTADVTPRERARMRAARTCGQTDAAVGRTYGHGLAHDADGRARAAYHVGWHVKRHEKLGVPLPDDVCPWDAEEYARGLYCEEAGESLVVVGSGLRFGHDTPGRDGTMEDSPRRALAKEMGDVLAAIEYACLSGLVDRREVEAMRTRKLAKLLDPQSRDNLGRRLAPPPLGYDEHLAVP